MYFCWITYNKHHISLRFYQRQSLKCIIFVNSAVCVSYTLVQSMLLTLGVPLFINSLTRVEGAGWAYEAYMYTAKEPPLPPPLRGAGRQQIIDLLVRALIHLPEISSNKEYSYTPHRHSLHRIQAFSSYTLYSIPVYCTYDIFYFPSYVQI